MATRTSTTRSDAYCVTAEPCGLAGEPMDLPVDPQFQPLAPTVSLKVLIERSADFRRWFPNGVPTEGQRLAAKCNREFAL